MSLKVKYVNGMPFVKFPLLRNCFIPECTCKIFNSKFGISVGVFLNESPPSVKNQLERLELEFRNIACKIKPKLELLFEDRYYDFELEELKLIKNGIFWGKFDFFPKVNEKMKASVAFQINHIFFSSQKVSISCNVSRIRKLPSST